MMNSKAKDKSDSADVGPSDKAVELVLERIGCRSGNRSSSRLVRLLKVLIVDALMSVRNEFPDIPEGAVIDVVGQHLDKSGILRLMSRTIDRYYESLPDMFKDLAEGNAVTRWNNREAKKSKDKDDSRHPSTDEEDVDIDDDDLKDDPVNELAEEVK